MLEVLCDGVIVFLPAIQRAVALETCCVVGVRLVWFVVESSMRQLETQSVDAWLTRDFGIHTSAGEGRWCGHATVFCDFVPEDLRFSGFKTMSKLARRAAKVSISEAMASFRTDL